MRNLRNVLLLLAMTFLASACLAQTLPRIESTTLDKQKIVIPDPSRYHALVLVVGFTHKSADQCAPWGKRLAHDYSDSPNVGYYQLPVLQGVPGMIKPMILRGMRSDVPAAEQAHFVPVYQHKDELEKIVGFKEEDDAYVIVAAPDGRVVWHTHGATTDEKYSQLQGAIASVVKK